jgi:omega-6 fatty acid desaturase (delta-12 desaturase)
MFYSNLALKYRSTLSGALCDFIPCLCLTGLSLYFLEYWYIVPLLSLLILRNFIIFHDCCHNSYTPSYWFNEVLGTILGMFVLTPFSWKYSHNTHHLTNGNMDNKFEFHFNELHFVTKKEYDSYHIITKTIFNIATYPIVFFSIAPFWVFFISHRFSHYSNGISHTIINNLGIAIMLYIFHSFGILFNYLLAIYFTSVIGVMLFHCQHTFNTPYIVKKNEDWNMNDSGLKGSSYILIPFWLRYFTNGIEYHHIHHLNSKIPSYNLHRYHNEVVSTSDKFENIVVLTMWDCYNNLFLRLFDEENNCYI